MLFSKLNFFSLPVFFLLLIFVSCAERDQFEFPDVYLYCSLNIKTDAEFISLNQPLNSLEITQHPNGDPYVGYDNNGIIIFNSGDYEAPFYVFDRTCPHDLPASIAISCDGGIATCPKCQSVYYLISDGLPTTGSVSKYYLKKYRTSYNPNTGDLIISN